MKSLHLFVRLSLLTVIAILDCSCEELDLFGSDDEVAVYSVKTFPDVVYTSPITATLKAEATLAPEWSPAYVLGFQYSTSAEMPPSNTVLWEMPIDGLYEMSMDYGSKQSTCTYQMIIASLDPSTTYYYRACARTEDEDEYKYGEIMSFTTKDLSELLDEKGAEIIDGEGFVVTMQVNLEAIESLYSEVYVGFEYGLSPTTLNKFVEDSINFTTGRHEDYKIALRKIEQPGTYWYRRYLKLGGVNYFTTFPSKTVYSETRSLTVNKAFNIPETVLLCGVYWATSNLGADNPEDIGDYFAWGDVEPYYEHGYSLSLSPVWKAGKESGYAESCYKWYDGSSKLITKYCSNYKNWGGDGEADRKTVIDPEDDAAHVILGGDWRLPTSGEWRSLLDNCTWKQATLNGVDGWMITYDQNYKIFLPATGRRIDTSTERPEYGFYWSSFVRDTEGGAVEFRNITSPYLTTSKRHYGIPIRPVCARPYQVE